MADVVLFHSALGLRPAVLAAADRLRDAGNNVWTPDLYHGRTADNLPDAIEIRDSIEPHLMFDRAEAAMADVPAGVVYAGYSLGASYAALVSRARGDASALVFLHDAPTFLPGIPATMHIADPDQWLVQDDLRRAEENPGTEVFKYAGCSHLFTDPETKESTPFDAAAADLTWERVIEFLERTDKRRQGS